MKRKLNEKRKQTDGTVAVEVQKILSRANIIALPVQVSYLYLRF